MLRLTPYLFHDQKTIINVYPLNTTTEPQKVMHVTPTLSTLLEKKKKKWLPIVLTFYFPLKISTINKEWSDAEQNRDQIERILQSYSRDNKYYILAIQRYSQWKLPRHCVCQRVFFSSISNTSFRYAPGCYCDASLRCKNTDDVYWYWPCEIQASSVQYILRECTWGISVQY